MRVTLQCSTRTDGPTQVHESVQMHQAVCLMYAITDTEGNFKNIVFQTGFLVRQTDRPGQTHTITFSKPI